MKEAKKYFVAVMVILVIAWTMYLVIEQPPPGETVMHGAGILVLIVAIIAAYNYWPKSKPAQEVVIAEATQVGRQITDLETALTKLSDNLDHAEARILDIQVKSELVISLIQSLAIRADQMSKQAEHHAALLTAIQSENTNEVFRLAGQIADPVISSLVFTSTTNPAYWQGTVKTIAANFGVLRLWSETYESYAQDLLLQVAKNQKALAELKARRELSQFVEPLALIGQNLNQAENFLRVERPALAGLAPGLRTALPTASPHLMLPQ